jgi:hypothetical protein
MLEAATLVVGLGYFWQARPAEQKRFPTLPLVSHLHMAP